MTPVSYDTHQFCVKTKALEQEAYDSAINQAKKIAQESINVPVFKISRKICDEAFKNFKESVSAVFPSEDYACLVDLTLDSRERLFFVTLKASVSDILRGPGADTEDQVQTGIKC